MEHFASVSRRSPSSLPMTKIIAFAIFSTRRQEEITRVRWDDYEPAIHGHPARILVRDMKDPENKAGNEPPIPKTIEIEIRDRPKQWDVQDCKHERRSL